VLASDSVLQALARLHAHHAVAVRHDAHDGADEVRGVALAVVAALDNGVKQLAARGHLQVAGGGRLQLLHCGRDLGEPRSLHCPCFATESNSLPPVTTCGA